MTVQMLRELLACLPADCDELGVYVELGGQLGAAQVVLIDPPNNMHGRPPRVTFTTDASEKTHPEIYAMVSPRTR